MTRLVVVGANSAGMSAARKAKRKREDLDVTVLEAGQAVPGSPCGVPALVAGALPGADALTALTPEGAGKEGIEVRLGHRAVGFNPYSKVIAYDGPGGRDEIQYDKLLIATGTRPRNPFEGTDLQGVFGLRHVADGVRLRQHLDKAKPKSVAVVGGGSLGLEMAQAFVQRDLEVKLVHKGSRLLESFDPDVTEGLADWVGKQGVEVLLGTEAKGVEAGRKAGHVGTLTTSKKAVKADLVLVAAGIVPQTEFAVKAGVQSTKEGFLLVDDNMHTNFHDVWAAGDCTAPRHIVTGRPVPMPLSLPSSRMGRVAGDNIAASMEPIPVGSSHFPGVLGTFATRIFGLGFAQTGVTATEAKAERMDVEAAVIESKSKAPYMAGAADIALKLLCDAHSGKLVGCQVAGPEDTVLRIQAAAVAIQHGLTAKKLAETETAYSPDIGPVWDPLLVAAGELAKKVRK